MTGFEADPFEDAFKLRPLLTSIAKDVKNAQHTLFPSLPKKIKLRSVHSVPIVKAKDE